MSPICPACGKEARSEAAVQALIELELAIFGYSVTRDGPLPADVLLPWREAS